MGARAGGGGPGSKRSAAPWAEKLNRDGISQSEPVSTGSELEALRRRGRSSGCSGRGEKRRERRRRRRREPGSPRPGGGEAASRSRSRLGGGGGGRPCGPRGRGTTSRSLRAKLGRAWPGRGPTRRRAARDRAEGSLSFWGPRPAVRTDSTSPTARSPLLAGPPPVARLGSAGPAEEAC